MNRENAKPRRSEASPGFWYTARMKGFKLKVHVDAPKIGEIFKHYKGDCYEVVLLAHHSNDEEWMVVYKPLYENPDAAYFTRPLREWREVVEWNGTSIERFIKIEK